MANLNTSHENKNKIQDMGRGWWNWGAEGASSSLFFEKLSDISKNDKGLSDLICRINGSKVTANYYSNKAKIWLI